MDRHDSEDLPAVEDTSAANMHEEIERLAGLPPAAYETERKNAAARLGWRTSVLDAEVEKARNRDLVVDQLEQSEFIECLEPWPDPVDGASLAEVVRDRLRAHVVFGADADADCATLWVFGSYLMDIWRLWPRLLITSPTRACGKSTLLEVIDALANRGFIVSNASPAAIFRVIEAWNPTLLLDEADTWMKQNEELAGILNSGHTRRAAYVLRVQEINGKHVPAPYSTWCPMVIAGIGSQRDTLMSRCILIGLRRKLSEETVERLPLDLHEQMLRVRRQIARWAADNALRINAMGSEPSACGNDRLQDNFTPLWRIAAALGGAWPDRIASAYAAQAQAQDDSEEPAGVMMLQDIAELFDTRTGQPDRIASSEIVSDLNGLEDRPWAEWRNGKPLTANTVAKLMKPFGIKTKVLKLNGSAARVYQRSEVEVAASRYATSMRNRVTLQENQQVNDEGKRNHEPEVTLEASLNPLKEREGNGVTLSGPGSGKGRDVEDPFDPKAWS